MGHHDESLIDKVKNALGMGDHDGHDEADARRAEDTGDRADGWAGVPEALYDDDDDQATLDRRGSGI